MASKYAYVKATIAARRIWANSFKDGPCIRCGIKYAHYVMDWYHRDRSTKKFGLGRGGFRWSRKAILEEIEKCDLLCANCHRIVEYEIRSQIELTVEP